MNYIPNKSDVICDETTYEAGTTTESSFNVVTITDDDKLVITRFGAGINKMYNL